MINNKQSGVTLIEILVTLFIMAIGLLGLAGLQSSTIKDGLDTAKRSQVMWLVSEIVERMRANPDGQLKGYSAAATGNICGGTPAKRCSDNSAGPAENNCTPDEMAKFDVWEVFCGQAEKNVIANAADTLNLNAVNISCVGGACTDQSDYSISISWQSLSVDNSKLLSDTEKSKNTMQTITMVVRP